MPTKRGKKGKDKKEKEIDSSSLSVRELGLKLNKNELDLRPNTSERDREVS